MKALSFFTHPFRTLLLAGSVAALVGCGSPEAAETSEASAPPTPSVSVAEVIHERVTEWDHFTGRLQAPQTVTLMPRISGYVEEIMFSEGALVEQGDVLFRIDNKQFVAEVQRLAAELDSAKTEQELALNDYERAQKLRAQRAISEELLDSRRARMHQTKAAVASVQASLDRAQLNLSYTEITAPISGRVSYAEVTAGNYITAGQSQLTSIVSTEKMYAYFDVDEQTFLKYTQLARDGERSDDRQVANPVFMALANTPDYAHVGEIDFVDNQLNQRTGTIRLRATFENSDQSLIPGLYARLRVIGSATRDRVLIDEKAIGTDLNNKFVLVLNADDKVEYRRISLGEKINGLRIVADGLQPEEKIVVNGLQRVMPNSSVTPQVVEMIAPEALQELRAEQQYLDNVADEVVVQLVDAQSRG